ADRAEQEAILYFFRSTHLEPMPVPNVPAVQTVQVVFRKFEETGGPFSTKVTRPFFQSFGVSLVWCT
ncbi:MAG TPA: hypothetical protein VGK65_22470, partial [Candidatus Binatia bacterium]